RGGIQTEGGREREKGAGHRIEVQAALSAVLLVLLSRCKSGDLGQQIGPGLGSRFARGQAVGVRLANLRIVLQRILIDPDQVLGVSGACREERRGDRGHGTLENIHCGINELNFDRPSTSRPQNENSGGRRALIRGSITVSNRLRELQLLSEVRLMRRASMTGDSPTTTNRRPPIASRR